MSGILNLRLNPAPRECEEEFYFRFNWEHTRNHHDKANLNLLDCFKGIIYNSHYIKEQNLELSQTTACRKEKISN